MFLNNNSPHKYQLFHHSDNFEMLQCSSSSFSCFKVLQYIHGKLQIIIVHIVRNNICTRNQIINGRSQCSCKIRQHRQSYCSAVMFICRNIRSVFNPNFQAKFFLSKSFFNSQCPDSSANRCCINYFSFQYLHLPMPSKAEDDPKNAYEFPSRPICMLI